MKILIDTNIIIPLEDSSLELKEKFAELCRLTSGTDQLLIHPSSYEDINQDKDEIRRNNMLARLSKYILLKDLPHLSENDELNLFGKPRKRNDEADNLILYSLYKQCAHWLITEDAGLIKKSRVIGENDRVLTVEQAINALKKRSSEENVRYPLVEDALCRTLDIKNPVFDSLRNGYSGFDEWFDDGAREGRKAWLCRDGDAVHSLCIYKIENDEIVTNDNRALPGKLLKLCTFKVVKHGVKLGELMLKQAFNYASSNNIDHIYLTVEPDEHVQLDNLLKDFGFTEFGTDRKGRDIVYTKPSHYSADDSHLSDFEFSMRYYPSVRYKDNDGYIIPIKPQYHSILFPELEKQRNLFSNINNSAGNAIKQAYVCHAPIKSIKTGDLVFFYRTQDEMEITTYGIVEKFVIESDPDKIYQWVAKRTVYSYENIEEMSGTDVKIILFRLLGHLDSRISYKRLLKLGVLSGPAQSITTIPRDKINCFLDEVNVDDCLISN